MKNLKKGSAENCLALRYLVTVYVFVAILNIYCRLGIELLRLCPLNMGSNTMFAFA